MSATQRAPPEGTSWLSAGEAGTLGFKAFNNLSRNTLITPPERKILSRAFLPGTVAAGVAEV